MHAHAEATGSRTKRVLKIALVLTGIYVGVLIYAGLRAHSLALLSEAGHNLSDFLALLLSWGAVYLQERPATATKTYGFHRAGVLAAFVNSGSLVVISFLIFYEAAQRLLSPENVHPALMIWTAAAGVAINGAISLLLLRSAHDVNIRSALLHMFGDTLSTAAVIAGGVAIAFTGRTWIDPALSFGIGALILWSSFGIVRETLNILLEGMPSGMDVNQIAAEIRGVAGVNDVHDLHVWSLGSNAHALSCHIAIADMPTSASDRILQEVNAALEKRFHIHHTTVQFEAVNCGIAHGCVIAVHDSELEHREES